MEYQALRRVELRNLQPRHSSDQIPQHAGAERGRRVHVEVIRHGPILADPPGSTHPDIGY
jgi:hypothetical protein